MARRGLSEGQNKRRRQAGWQINASGERPAYHVRPARHRRSVVVGTRTVADVAATGGGGAMAAARAMIAVWLEVEPDDFDVEV